VMKQREMDSRVEHWGQVERELSKLSSTKVKEFKRSSGNILMILTLFYREKMILI
jgi:hypothetical protein